MKIPTDMLYKFWQQKVIWTARSVLLHLQDLVSLKCVLECLCVWVRERKTMKQRLCAITSVTGCLPCTVCDWLKKSGKTWVTFALQMMHGSCSVCVFERVCVFSLPYASLSFCTCPHLPVWTSMSFSVEKDGSELKLKRKRASHNKGG